MPWTELSFLERAAQFRVLGRYCRDGISFAVLLFVVIRRLIMGDPVAGWASIFCSIVFIDGIQLLCLGIMAQYLARIYLEAKKRPHYIIAETEIVDAH